MSSEHVRPEQKSPIREPLPERLEEILSRAKVIIGLGKNWRRDISRLLEINKQRKAPGFLSIETKLIVIAVFEAYQLSKARGNNPTVVFCGGPTGREFFPAEAEAMREYFLSLFRNNEEQPDQSLIIVETESLHTWANAENLASLAKEEGEEGLALSSSGPSSIAITVAPHLPRAKRTFARLGLLPTWISAESITRYRSEHHQNFIRRYIESGSVVSERLRELLARLFALARKDRINRGLAELFRGKKIA